MIPEVDSTTTFEETSSATNREATQAISSQNVFDKPNTVLAAANFSRQPEAKQKYVSSYSLIHIFVSTHLVGSGYN
jgi:hypothetical protein